MRENQKILAILSELKNGKGPHLDQFAFDVDPQTDKNEIIEAIKKVDELNLYCQGDVSYDDLIFTVREQL